MRFALPFLVALAGCPKHTPEPSATVLSAADLATLSDARSIIRLTAGLPDVKTDPHACRAFVYLDFVFGQVEDVGAQLRAAPECLPAAVADSTACPARPNASDPLLSQAAADKAVDTAEVVSLMVLTIKDSHVGDPAVSAWADLAVQRLADLGEEVVQELADPDDVLSVPGVCVR